MKLTDEEMLKKWLSDKRMIVDCVELYEKESKRE